MRVHPQPAHSVVHTATRVIDHRMPNYTRSFPQVRAGRLGGQIKTVPGNRDACACDTDTRSTRDLTSRKPKGALNMVSLDHIAAGLFRVTRVGA